MNIKELIALVPEAQRPDAEKAISEAVVAANPVAGIDSNEKAAAFIQGNKFFKGALDSEISVKIASHDEKFQKDKLPGLVDAKIKELNPPKDPRDIEIAEIKKQLADRDRKELEAKQREIALKLAASEGIPVEGIERFIADNDDATTAQVKAQAKIFKAWHEGLLEVELKKALGNNGIPKGGNVTPPADLKTQYDAAVKAGNGIEMLKLKGLMQAANTQE